MTPQLRPHYVLRIVIYDNISNKFPIYLVIRMVHVKNYETVFTFIKSYAERTVDSFSNTVYIEKIIIFSIFLCRKKHDSDHL